MIPNFDWDPEKALVNAAKHGVTFEEAATVFGDDDAFFGDDESHAGDEDRFIIIGISARERMLLTVYTIRRADVIRIISSRRALSHERQIYEEKNRRI
jgi:uncharacterized protein